VPDISALYPQPPQQNQNVLAGDPTKLLGGLQQINQIQYLGKTIAAKQALGQAYQNALQPDGTVDLGKVATQLKSDPNAAFIAPEAASNILDQHGKMIANDTASFEQYAKQSDFARAGLSSLLGKAQNGTLTPEDIHNWTVTMSRNTDPRAVPSSVLSSVSNGIFGDPAGIRSGVITLANGVMGPAAGATRVTGQPTPGGAPQQTSQAQANYTGTYPTQLAPGESELLSDPAKRAADLQATASTTAQYHADFDNLKQESKVLDNLGGPTQPFEKKANEVLARFGLSGLGTMTPDQLRAAESFDKIVNGISLRQGSVFGGTDAARNMILGATPNTGMSRYGRDGMIDMAQGNQDATDRARSIWFDARAKGAPASSHDIFMDQLTKPVEKDANGNWIGGLDPRIFQFNRLSRDNQQKFLGQMDPDDVGDFEQKYQAAIDRKWVKPLKKVTANGSQ
jgi:hypothetical protein